MTRILTMAVAAIIGWIIGLLPMWYFEIEYIPLISAVICAISGYIMSNPDGIPIKKDTAKNLKRGMDMMLIIGWGAAPAIHRLIDSQPRYLDIENSIMLSSIPQESREATYNFEEIISFFRESMKSGTKPIAALKRHNRAFRPRFYTKKSASYTILLEVARATVIAGADRRGVVWYFYFAEQLHVPVKDAYSFLQTAIQEQIAEPRMIPGYPAEGTPITTASQGLPIPQEYEVYLEAYDRGRKAILTAMFGEDEEWAA